jgi:hypothetical protein
MITLTMADIQSFFRFRLIIPAVLALKNIDQMDTFDRFPQKHPLPLIES